MLAPASPHFQNSIGHVPHKVSKKPAYNSILAFVLDDQSRAHGTFSGVLKSYIVTMM